jgi:WD40 repeat protein
VLSVVFSSDGKHLFSSGRDQRILIWNIEKGTKEFELHEHRARVECLCLSPKGSLLASGDWDGTVKIWDLLKRQSIATIPAHKDAVLSIAFSPDGREMVTGAQDREPLKIWLVDGWKQKAVLRKDDYSARCVLFLSDDEFVVGTNLRTIQMWNLKSEKLVTFWRPHQSWVTRFAMLPDGKRFASGADDIKIWDINDARNKSPGKD